MVILQWMDFRKYLHDLMHAPTTDFSLVSFKKKCAALVGVVCAFPL
jgi:hypothetical protein